MFFICFLVLAVREVGTPYFPYLVVAVVLLFVAYVRQYSWKDLAVGAPIFLILSFLLSHPKVSGDLYQVAWIKEKREDYRVAITKDYKFVRLKDDRVEVGDYIDREGELLLKGKGIGVFFERLRARIYRDIESSIDYPISSVVGALTLGVRYELPPSLKGYFSLSGLYHFLAISGLHVGIVIGALAFFLKLLRVPKPFTVSSLLLLPLLPLTGLPSSVLRAYLFTLLVSLGVESFRRITPLYLLGVVFLISLLFGKFNLSAVLSFLAVGGILLSLYGSKSSLERSVKVAVAPLLFTSPVIFYLFGTQNLLSFLTTPLVGLIFSPFLISSFLSEITLFKVSFINSLTQFLGELFIYGCRLSFSYTKFAVVHSELSLPFVAGALLLTLAFSLFGLLRYSFLPLLFLVLFSALNQTVVSNKVFFLKGWKLNSFRFVATEGQKYRNCKIISTYVYPATRKLLFRDSLIDVRLKRLERKKF